ncbi:MAG: mechanosensitive ion channel family protein [Deltaproteobacteria bacterium]|nr:mechanosensitive ion channel family protein [Deltaproteobacteria bacterium]
MTMQNLQWIQWVYPLAYLVGGFVAGILFKSVALARIKRLVGATLWEGDDIIVEVAGKFSIPLFTIGGLYLAFLHLPIPLKIVPLLQKTLLVLSIFIVTLALAKIAVGLVALYSRKGKGTLPSTSIFTNLARVTVLAIGILVILQSLGISITPILTALGVGGLAVALALQETLSNLFAGLHILVSRQVRPGDYVQLDSGEAGYVTDISWRNTTIRALSNNMIIVPNIKMASTIITNFHHPEQEMSFLVEVGVSYESDLKQVERVTIDVAREVLKEVQGGVPLFEPFIRYHTFADFSINFTVILRAKEFVDQYLIKHEFVKRLHERYQQEKIEIPFPIRTVQMKQT